MASTLQEQLQRLAAAAGIVTGKAPRGKPSLLYTFQEAADVGIQDVYAIALQGFDQLCRIDPRFQSFRKTLFSPATQTMDRDQQTPEINSKLDASIAGYCDLLSSYFLLPAAFKTLEYLVRRFKAYEMNVPALMHAALPYHATNEFVRMVQILHLENTPFAFLGPMQKNGVALPRELLVQRCLADRSLLRFVCDAAQQLGGPRVAARAVMPFFAALLCEIIAATPAVDEPMVAMLLPYIVHGLSADVSLDYRAAIYMLLVQLATRASFTNDLSTAVVLELCKSATPASLPQVLLVLCHLAVTQSALDMFPANAFKHLAKLPGLAAELRILASKGPRSRNLLALVTTATAAQLGSHDNYARLMDELLTTVPLGSAAGPVADKLLSMIAAGTGKESTTEAIIKALRTLDLRYPEVTEKAVNNALQRTDGKDKASVETKDRLASALEAAFAGSLRAPMLEAGTTLALAVDAASAGIRRLALERLGALADGKTEGADSPNAEAEQVLRGALLRRLADDHPAVVQTALGLDALLRLPPTAVLEGLSGCLHTALAAATVKEASKDDRADARGIARKVVKILSGPFVEQNPEYVDRAAALILTTVLSAPHTRKVAENAVKRGKKVDHPLLRALANADIDAANPTVPPPASTTKAKRGKTPQKAAAEETPAPSLGAKGYDDAAHNRAVVEALAREVATNADAQQALAVLLDSSEGRAKTLALVIANIAMKLDGGAPLAGEVLKRFAAQDAAVVSGAKNADTATFDTDSDVADDATMLAVATGALKPAHVQPAVVLTALRLLPSASLSSLGREGLERLFGSLCALSVEVWGQHLDVLVARAGEIVDAVQLLSDLWGDSVATATSSKVQTTALRLWTQAVLNASPASPSKGARGRGKAAAAAPVVGAAALAALPRLLAVLGHTDRSMRITGVDACHSLATGADAWWPEGSDTSGLDKSTTVAILGSISAQSAAIKADSEAAESLLRNSFEFNGNASPEKAPKGRKKAAGGATSPAAAARLNIDISQATALREFLLAELPRQRGSAGLNAVPFVVRVIHDVSDPAELLLLAGYRLLGSFALEVGNASAVALRPLGSALERAVASQLVSLYTDAALTALLGSSSFAGKKNTSADAGEVDALVGSLLAMLAVPGREGWTEVRRIALSAVTPVAYRVFPEEAQRTAFVALTAASTQDADQACRDAAHAALASLPLTADTIIPLLTISAPQEESKGAPRRKRRAGDAGSNSSTAAGRMAGFPSLIATVEVLQWKDDVIDEVQMVPQLQITLDEVLQAVAATHGTASESEGQDIAEEADDEDLSATHAAQAYAMQLLLALLHNLARRHVHAVSAEQAMAAAAPTATPAKGGRKTTTAAASKKGAIAAAGHPFDIAVAVRCAQAAPDAAVRSAALGLVGILAGAMPQAALDHVLAVVSVVGDASSELLDAHSSAVVAQSLGAVASAWVSSGGDQKELVEAVVGAASGAPAPRRLPLLRALVAALPEVSGLCMVVLGLLQWQLAGFADGGEKGKEEHPGLSLAKALLQQSSAVVQAQTLASLLQTAMNQNDQDPSAPLVLLSTAFATSRLEATPARLLDVSHEEEPLQQALEALMQRALAQLQRAGELAAAAAQPTKAKSKATAKPAGPAPSSELLKTATKAAYALTEELSHVMRPAAYVGGLVRLVGRGRDEKVRRRALSLLSAAIAAEETDRRGKEPAPALVAVALEAVGQIAGLLSSVGGANTPDDLTLQVALGALGSLGQGFAARHPQAFIAAVPAVLALTKPAQSQPVRGSALACVAALAQSLGRQMVPVLPPTVAAVLEAAQRAAQAVAAASAESDSDEDEGLVSEASALELAASLSALAALVSSLGAFLASHLPQVLAVVLNPAVLSCNAAHCSELAASIRSQLAREIPARLLLGPLASELDAAASAGADSACALLSMLRLAIERMDAAAIAAYRETVFLQLLRAMDLRCTGAVGAAASAAADAVEAAAVSGLVELTLKLSESQFKPLFFRLVEWATSTPAADATAGPAALSLLPRAVALLAAANALSERLRSVFTPYFQPLMDPIIAALTGSGAGGAAGAGPSKKKRKKAALSEAGTSGDIPAEVAPLEGVLRLAAVRALHRCFLHDTSSFLDEARFDRLLTPLVAQLHVAPTPEEISLLQPDLTLEASLSPEAQEALDVLARALVACLAQMALAAGGGDARWRPLNHAVLMATRSPELRTRVAALEAAAALANALQEEYLPLLPEALPFLAELLEDGQHEVEARAAATLRALEALSGEDLKEYLK